MSSKGIEVDPKKTDAVKSWPRPLTPFDIRSFLGLTDYYRRFVGMIFIHSLPMYQVDSKEGQVPVVR